MRYNVIKIEEKREVISEVQCNKIEEKREVISEVLCNKNRRSEGSDIRVTIQ